MLDLDQVALDAARQLTPANDVQARATMQCAIISALRRALPAEPEALRLRDELAEFEAWAAREGYEIVRHEHFPGGYVNKYTREAWCAWQAALAATGKQQVGESCTHEWRTAGGGSQAHRPLVCSKCNQHRDHMPQQVGEVQGDGLPAKDTTTSNTAQGLYRKFEVSRTDASDKPGGKHHGCEYFVLDMTHDPHAKAAANAYADSVQATHPQLAAGMRDRYALAARQPVGQEPVCSGGFVIGNGNGEKYMAWGQKGPEWVADRSAALWLVRRADAEALAAENEDAWLILPVERCTLPPNGWACTLASGHEGPCPTIATQPAQALDMTQLRGLMGFALYQAIQLPETDPRRDYIRQANELVALIDKAVQS